VKGQKTPRRQVLIFLTLGVEQYFYFANKHEKTTISPLKCLMTNEPIKNIEIPKKKNFNFFQSNGKMIIVLYMKRQH